MVSASPRLWTLVVRAAALATVALLCAAGAQANGIGALQTLAGVATFGAAWAWWTALALLILRGPGAPRRPGHDRGPGAPGPETEAVGTPPAG